MGDGSERRHHSRHLNHHTLRVRAEATLSWVIGWVGLDGNDGNDYKNMQMRDG